MIRVIGVFFLLVACYEIQAQDTSDNKPKVNFNLSVINRTVFELTYSFNPSSRINLEDQLSGAGINYGFVFYLPAIRMGLCGGQSIRYDHIFYELPANIPGMNYAKNVRGLIIDYHFDVQKYWNFKTWSFIVSAGVSLMNTGTDYVYSNITSSLPGTGNSYQYKNSRFNAYNFNAGCSVRNLNISVGCYYSSNAYNYPNAPKLLIPEAKIGYSFKVIR